jgi:hypothetical protein
MVLCDLYGKILFYGLFRGHCNDQLTYLYSKLNYILVDKDIYLMTDKGYHGSNLISPNDKRIKEHGLRGFYFFYFWKWIHW